MHRNARAAVGVLIAIVLPALVVIAAEPSPSAATRTETFDRDPNWDRANNRPADRRDQPVTIRQDFGFSATSHAGGKGRPGEVGGFVQAAAEPAHYGKVLSDLTFDQPLSASGKLAIADGGCHLLLGFFNAATSKEWRTPNTVAIRINGRGENFFAYVEYCTSKWRAGGDTTPFPFNQDPQTGRKTPKGFGSGRKVHAWSLKYDPRANGGAGSVTATIDGQTAVCDLDPGHKSDGAVFNRFGLLNVMKSADDGTEIHLDDVAVNGGPADSFDVDPKWEGKNNRKTFPTRNVRPRFDFGFSPTRFAGGPSQGELGGLVFRGDCRYPERMAYYADKVGPLTLDKPFKASGKVALRRGVSDSTTLFGFFNRATAMRSNPSQSDGLPEGVLGINIEGPSREGFTFYPVSRPVGGNSAHASGPQAPHILPDGKPHDWTFTYDPAAATGNGRIVVTLDGKSVSLDLKDGERGGGTVLDRFGIVTPWIDGNGQDVYFDDVTYTVRQ